MKKVNFYIPKDSNGNSVMGQVTVSNELPVYCRLHYIFTRNGKRNNIGIKWAEAVASGVFFNDIVYTKDRCHLYLNVVNSNLLCCGYNNMELLKVVYNQFVINI